MNGLEKIIRPMVLFAAVVLSAGVARGQERTEDFQKVVERFVSDCEFQRSRVVFPVEALQHDEDTVRVVVVDEKDWGGVCAFF